MHRSFQCLLNSSNRFCHFRWDFSFKLPPRKFMFMQRKLHRRTRTQCSQLRTLFCKTNSSARREQQNIIWKELKRFLHITTAFGWFLFSSLLKTEITCGRKTLRVYLHCLCGGDKNIKLMTWREMENKLGFHNRNWREGIASLEDIICCTRRSAYSCEWQLRYLQMDLSFHFSVIGKMPCRRCVSFRD